MGPEKVREVLYGSAQLRMPKFNGDTMPRSKIERLEEYLLATARWRSYLEEGRLYMQDALRQLRSDWDHLDGWETFRRKGEKTQASVDDAKRQINPDLYDSIQEAEFLVKRCSEAIRRLEHDDEVASRAYTFITGGG